VVKFYKSALFLGIISIICAFNLQAQLSERGVPPGLRYHFKSSQDIEDMPSLDMDKIALEDKEAMNNKLKPFRFAVNHEVNFSINNSGEWTDLPDGSKYWSIKIRSYGAYALIVYFSEYTVPDGAQVYVYNEDKSVILGAYTSKNNNQYNLLNISPVSGEMVTVEYLLPAHATSEGKLTIGEIGHDYKNVFGLKDGRMNLSGSCEVNVNCPVASAYHDSIKRAVCRLLINEGASGDALCSGTLINNVNHDGTPYVLTANHCISDSVTASKTLFLFNYEAPVCDSARVLNIDGYGFQTLSVSSLIATSPRVLNPNSMNEDFTLLRIKDKPPFSYRPFYAGWNRSTFQIDSVAWIHHPYGDVTKFSRDDSLPPVPNSTMEATQFSPYSHWLIRYWDLGCTEPGSSGSALLDQKHRIVGDLSGGFSKCGSPIDDYFQMFSLAWNPADTTTTKASMLQPWLDPNNTEPESIDGYDPYNNPSDTTFKTCVAFNTINKNTDTLTTAMPFNSLGWWGGQNSAFIMKYAQEFKSASFTKKSTDSTTLIGLYFKLRKNNYSYPNSGSSISSSNIDTFNIVAWNGNDVPVESTAAGRTKVYMNEVHTDAYLTPLYDSIFSDTAARPHTTIVTNMSTSADSFIRDTTLYLSVPDSGVDPNGIFSDSMNGKPFTYNYIPLINPVRFIGNIFIGIEIYYNIPQDTLALAVYPRLSQADDSVFVYYINNNVNDSTYLWYKDSALLTTYSYPGLKLDIIPWFCNLPAAGLPPVPTQVKAPELSIVSVYPNPSSGFITVSDANTYVAKNLDIYNISGNLVKSVMIISGQVININDLSNGVYILKISDADKVQYAKIILVK